MADWTTGQVQLPLTQGNLPQFHIIALHTAVSAGAVQALDQVFASHKMVAHFVGLVQADPAFGALSVAGGFPAGPLFVIDQGNPPTFSLHVFRP